MKKNYLLFLVFAVMGLNILAQSSWQNRLVFFNSVNKQELNADRGINSIIFNPSREVDSNWDTTASVWNFQDSIRSTYNSSGNITLKLNYSSDPVHPNKTVYIYNGNGKLTSDTSSYWNGSSYTNSQINTFTYDIHGNQTEDLIQSWNGTAWANSYKMDYTYDANNNQTEIMYQIWTGTAWNYQFKEDFTYTAGNLTQAIGQNGSGTTWTNSSKSDFTYTGGQISGAIEHNWNGTTWVNYRNHINMVWYQYTSLFDCKEASETTQVPNGTLWKDSLKDNYTYDVHGNQTDFTEQSKPASTYVTTDEQKNIYQYDGNNNITENIFQNWNHVTHAVRNSTKKDYSEFHQYTGISEINTSDAFVLFPNPNNGKFQVKSSGAKAVSIVIYNLTGEKVYESKAKNSNFEIDLSAQSKGVYFMQLIDENKNAAYKKIVLQ